jgi:exosortase A
MSGSDAHRESIAGGPLQAAAPLAIVTFRLAIVLVVLLLPAVLYLPTVASLITEWEDTGNLTYTHGYLVVVLSVWLVYRKRQEIASVSARPSFPVLVPLAVVSLLWLMFLQAGIQLGHQVLFPLLIWLGVLAAFGWPIARLTAIPVSYLYFAVPIWSLANGAIQALSVYAVRGLLRIAGVPAYFEGNFVHIPTGVFEIAGGCSGLHFLIVALALAALGGEVSRDTWRIRLALVALAGGLSIIGNWFRIFTIIVAGHVTDMQHYLIRVDHYYFGWGVFAVVMTIFFLIIRRLPASQKNLSATDSRTVAEQGSAVRPVFGGVAAAVAVLAVGPAWGLVARGAATESGQAALPATVSEWRGPFPGATEWLPRFVGADHQAFAVYQDDSGEVSVFVATYLRQEQGKELIGYDNSVIGEGAWRARFGGRFGWQGIALNESIVSRDVGSDFVVWSTYEIGGRHFARGLSSQLWYGFASLAGAPVSRVVAVRAECAPLCDDARDRLGRFLEQSGLLAGHTARQGGVN